MNEVHLEWWGNYRIAPERLVDKVEDKAIPILAHLREWENASLPEAS